MLKDVGMTVPKSRETSSIYAATQGLRACNNNFFFLIKRTTVQYKKIKNYTYLKIMHYTGLIKTKQLIQQGYLALTGYQENRGLRFF